MSGLIHNASEATSSSTSIRNPRSRLRTSDILNIIKERMGYLKSSNHFDEAKCLENMGFSIQLFIQDNVPDEESFSSKSEMRAVWRKRIDQFIELCAQEGEPVTQLNRESIVDIFMAIAHSTKISELDETIRDLTKQFDETIGDLTKQLNEARSIFTPRQALEKIVNGIQHDRANRFSTLLMTDANLQAIFDRKFGGYIWHGNKLNKYTPLGVKTAMSRQLFNECYQRSSDVEIHYRPGSAPPFGVVVNSANYLPLQKVFLDVVATYLNKNLVLI